MTSKLVVNTIEADTGISSVSFASSISMSSTSKFHFSNAGIDIGADTNINRPTAGVLGFNINSSEKARIDSSGRLLIGTTTEGVSTADDLTIATSGSTGITIRSGSGNAGNIAFSDGTSGDDEIRGLIQYHHNDNVMKLFTNATERFRITSGGTVGINQSSPDSNSKLDVMSDATGTTVNSNRVALFRTNGGGRDAHITLSNSSNTPVHIGQLSSDLYFTTNNQERVRIASDGEVFIGTGLGSGNRSTLLSIAGANQNPSGVWTQVGVYSDDSQAANKGGSIGFGGQDGSTPKQQFAAIKGAKENSTSGNYAGYMAFYTRPAGAVSQERLRITSAGHVLFNCTSLPSTSVAGAGFEKNGSQAILFSSSGSSTASSNHAEFINGNGVVGRINTNGSSTTYYTSSDYRLKENQVAISDGITRLKSLKPYRFNFKADSTKTVDGFFAHEVSPVVPEAIGGEKDAVDSDNNPVYQDIDHSKLVPLLTAALQEAITEIETLKTKVAALEGS